MKKEIDPRMHSAEHILNKAMVRKFGCARAFSTHIEKKKSKCDYLLDKEPSQEEIGAIERRVNEIINLDLAVTEEFLSKKEAETRYSLERLPQNTGQMIRIIHTGDYDACPCIGTHVQSTGEIGHFEIASYSYENKRLRIRYRLRG